MDEREEAEMVELRSSSRSDAKKWKMPPRYWSAAKAQFAVVFGDRFAVNR
jgi:transposase-like protein